MAASALDVFGLLADTGDTKLQFLEWLVVSPDNSNHRHAETDRLQVMLGRACTRMLALFPQHGPSAHEAFWVWVEQGIEHNETSSMTLNDSDVSNSGINEAQETCAMQMHDRDVPSVPNLFVGQDGSPVSSISLTTTEEFDVFDAMRHAAIHQ